MKKILLLAFVAVTGVVAAHHVFQEVSLKMDTITNADGGGTNCDPGGDDKPDKGGE